MITSELKKFIEANIDLIEADDFDNLYIKAHLARQGFMTPNEVTHALLDSGIDPMEYLTYVPQEYMKGFDITEVPWPVNDFDLIQSRAFAYCKKLTEVTIPEGVAVIGNSAFVGCEKLETLHLPKTLLSIGHTAFFGTNLKTITYAGTVKDWEDIVDQENNWLARPRAATLTIQCIDGTVKPEV